MRHSRVPFPSPAPAARPLLAARGEADFLPRVRPRLPGLDSHRAPGVPPAAAEVKGGTAVVARIGQGGEAPQFPWPPCVARAQRARVRLQEKQLSSQRQKPSPVLPFSRLRVPGALVAGIALLALSVSSAPALAQPFLEPVPVVGSSAAPPSPFETGMRGFGIGLSAGLAGGYLVARENGFTSSDWRPLVAGAGIGALAGGVLGFTLGMIDNSSRAPGRGYLVMRGMSYGGGFGMLAGAIVGGLAALETDKPEHILLGAAIGTLSGTALGLILGSVERNPWAAAPVARAPLAWNLGVGTYTTAIGGLAIGPSLSGQFGAGASRGSSSYPF